MGILIVQKLQAQGQFDLRLEFSFGTMSDLEVARIAEAADGFAFGDVRRDRAF